MTPIEMVASAAVPQDLFGPADRSKIAESKKVWVDFQEAIVRSGIHRIEQDEMNRKLHAFWYEWSRQSSGRGDLRYEKDGSVFRVQELIGLGDLTSIYYTECNGQPSVLKWDIKGDNEAAILNEAGAIHAMWDSPNIRFRPYVPELLGSFNHEGSAGNVLNFLEDFVSLAYIKEYAYPDGIDIRDAAWMYRRLLVALGFAHNAGVIHGAVLPEHILIHPEKHGLVLIDWCYSTRLHRQGLERWVEKRRDFYAPEALWAGKKPPVAMRETDIYMATKSIEYLLDGNVPQTFKNFFTYTKTSSVLLRPGDAWTVKEDFDKVLDREYERKFRPFVLPEPA